MKKILLIEDEEPIRRVLIRILEKKIRIMKSQNVKMENWVLID